MYTKLSFQGKRKIKEETKKTRCKRKRRNIRSYS